MYLLNKIIILSLCKKILIYISVYSICNNLYAKMLIVDVLVKESTHIILFICLYSQNILG